MAYSQERKERLLEATVAALIGAGGSLKLVVTNKALFYADLVALRDFGKTITENEYLALPNGPTVAGYKTRLVRDIEAAGLAKTVHEGFAKPLRLTEAGRAKEFVHLSEDERGILEGIGKDLASWNSNQISEVSHRNPGWIAASNPGGQAKPIDMLLALQDPLLFEDDEGGFEETDEDLRSLCDASESGEFVSWD